MNNVEGKVLRSSSYVRNGETTFVLDILLKKGGIVRASLHSNVVDDRILLARLAVTAKGDHVKLEIDSFATHEINEEIFLYVDRLRLYEVRCVD